MSKLNKFNEYLEKAEDAFYSKELVRAVHFYKKALAIKKISVDAYVNIAECYHENGMLIEAENFFKKAIILDSTNKKALTFYAYFLFYSKDECTKAEEIYFKLLERYPNDETLYLGFVDLYHDYDWSPNYEKAIKFLKEGIKYFPNEKNLISGLLDLYVETKNLKEAKKLFNKLLKNGKSTFDHYRSYTTLLKEENDNSLLVKVLESCILQYPRDTKYHKELIGIYSETENHDLVIITYEKMFSIECDNISNYYKLAKYLLEKGELNKANEYYNKAANINYSIVLFNQAYVLSNAPFNHYNKAIELYKEVLKLNPSNFNAYVNMGVCFSFLQQYHESLSSYSKAIEINPYYDLPYENAGNAYRKTGDLSKAIDYYKKALKLNPENYKVAGNLGVTYYSLEKYKEALKFYEISIQFSHNKDIKSYYNIALLYNKLKKYAKAIESCQSALDLYSDYTPSELMFNKYAIYYTLGRANFNFKKKDIALKHFLKSLELNRNYKDTYIYIGIIYNELEKLELAKEYLDTALKMDPQDFCALENLGWNSYLKKDFVTALKYTKESIKLNSENADGFYNLGKIYSATKKEEQATKMFKKAALLGHKKASKLAL